MTENEIKDNFYKIREEIHAVEAKAGRAAGSVRLCAVSKFHPVEDVYAAMQAGPTPFGENRVQEASAKFRGIRESGKECTLHIIGALQLNKVKKAAEIASCIESADREELLAELEKHCARLGKNIEIYFELHTGEDSKSGYPDEASLLESAQHCAEGRYPHIVPAGLMTMAPFTSDEKEIRKSFATLRSLQQKLRSEFPSLRLDTLSMGMSGDYRIAIEEGSTEVRIGTALFGARA